jgi:uroporphyrinogen III methyltransferase/synthase
VARVGGTVVVLMGVATRAAIAERLIGGGLDPATPVAAVRWGTRPEQSTVRTTLAELGATELEAPATIVVGAVAGLDLRWFEDRPLFGRRVVVTRAREQASDLSSRLAALGADVVEVPSIALADPSDGGAALSAGAGRAGDYDWAVFTSVNTVERFFAQLHDARDLGGVLVAAIGPGTAAALARAGVVADLVPESYVAESLLDAFPAGAGRVLLPRAAVARDVLPDGLAAKGWTVDVVEAYRTEPVPASGDLIAAAATADAITFTSSSTVTNFLDTAGADAVPALVVCIGPITAGTAAARGLRVDAVAAEHTIDGLVAALCDALARR